MEQVRLLESLPPPKQEEVGTVALLGLAPFEASSTAFRAFCVLSFSTTVTTQRQDDDH